MFRAWNTGIEAGPRLRNAGHNPIAKKTCFGPSEASRPGRGLRTNGARKQGAPTTPRRGRGVLRGAFPSRWSSQESIFTGLTSLKRMGQAFLAYRSRWAGYGRAGKGSVNKGRATTAAINFSLPRKPLDGAVRRQPLHPVPGQPPARSSGLRQKPGPFPSNALPS